MPHIIPDQTIDERIEKQRQKARDHLDEIRQRARDALDQAGIGVPVFLLVPASRNSIVVLGTPDDVDDALWERTSTVVQDVVRQVMDFTGVSAISLACAKVCPDPAAGVTSSAAE